MSPIDCHFPVNFPQTPGGFLGGVLAIKNTQILDYTQSSFAVKDVEKSKSLNEGVPCDRLAVCPWCILP